MKGGWETVRFSGAGLFFAGALILTGLAGITVYSFMRAAVQTETVIETVRDLPPGATISEEDVAVLSVPLGGAPQAALRDPETIIGRRVRYGLAAGSFVQSGSLVEIGSDLASRVRELGEDLRVVKVPLELMPGPAHLVPGDRLELTGVFPIQEERTSTLLTVPLGTVTVMEVPDAEAGDADSILVAADAQQASLLALTMQGGNLMVGVLGHEQETPPAPALRLDNVLDGWGTRLSGQPAAPGGK